MGRPRAFDEDEAVLAAAALFAERGYEGTSVDDLVQGLGVHRGSLYKVFGSKRGLYLTALRRHLDQDVLPLTAAIGAADGLGPALAQAAAAYDSGPAAGFLLLAAVERAPVDPETAELVAEGLGALEAAIGRVPGAAGQPALAEALAAAVLGLRLRSRASGGRPAAGAVLALTDHLRA
ncbi:TetR/AcrR family transcriptional regulator [Kitasatospora sp. NPDC048365]|uniref:TetR/AcrR family transcriptional regulator n=1 Tax=Kitasatospora sp. NPDC048365 TaxID=3364050 RepID=UPI0037111C49